jgi:hypothetical protein
MPNILINMSKVIFEIIGYVNSLGWYTFYPQKLALTSPTSGDLSVSIVRSLAQATEFFLFVFYNGQQITDSTVFKGPPLWSSGQSSWLQIRRPGFDSRHYQIF